jgi:branched-chain amino acid transport system ATP-binding protein
MERRFVSDILTAEGLSKAFGNVQAVADISMDVRRGEILGILGPNGSGKTTLFNLLTGVHKPDGGRVVFNGRDITRMPVHERVRLGIGRTYQIPRPFGNMTVLENLLVAATQGARKSEPAARDDVDEILELTGLGPLKYHFARTLTLLDRKRLETARALATGPELLLLDEIAGGLTEAEAHQVLKIIRAVNARGVSIIWIEHLMAMMEGVDRILALDQGRHLLCGAPKDVMSSEEVVACYMGVEDES